MKKELIDKINKQGELAFIWEAYKKTSSII